MAGEVLRAGITTAAAALLGMLVVMGVAILPSAGQQDGPRAGVSEFYKAHVLDTCCMIGMQWSNATGRCSNYPAPVPGVAADSQSACLSIVEVCCLKQVQLDMCESGKRTALESHMCAVRDSDSGAEQFRECCKCCQMGVHARRFGSCEVPGLGEPCDSKFAECCTGRPSANFTIPAFREDNPSEGGEDERQEEEEEGQGNDEDVEEEEEEEEEEQEQEAEEKENKNGDNNNNNDNNDNDNEDEEEEEKESNDVDAAEQEGDGVDECTLFSGHVCSHLCVDLPSGFRCDCPPGFDLAADKRTCTFLDADAELDCNGNNPCEQRCVNRNSGPECQCYEGYRLNNDRRTCADVDECEEGSYRCAPSQRCVNTKGGYSCLTLECPPGKVRNPRTGQCENSNACVSGYTFNSLSRRCEDINECALGYDNCKVGERCENTNGGFTCRRIHHCGTGYTLDEASQQCVDNDECVLGTHNCGGGFQCQNVQGSFRCVPKQCPMGSRFDSVTGDCRRIHCRRGMRPNRAGSCVDINECAEGSHRCQRHQRCINRVGTYHCRNLVECPPGYEATSNNGCQDINECTSGKHRCSADQECVNRQGSYFCQCPRGMRHDASGRCVDPRRPIPDSRRPVPDSRRPVPDSRRPVPDSRRPVPDPRRPVPDSRRPYPDSRRPVPDPRRPFPDPRRPGPEEDIDECLTDNLCQHKCRNVRGSYFCTCNRGYQLREDKRSCEDIDECTQFRGIGGRGGVCGGRCINTPGSYRCECPEGWRLKRDGRSCEDIDECQENMAFCPQQDGLCINTRGSYKCPVVRCPEGFAKTTSSGPQHREFIAEEDGVVCGRMDCEAGDRSCLQNKTKTIAWQFLAIPTVEFVNSPVNLLNIRTVAYSIYPNLHLRISEGNERQLFDTVVRGDTAALRLLKPVSGPAELDVTLVLENRDFSKQVVISRHVTYVKIYVSEYPM